MDIAINLDVLIPSARYYGSLTANTEEAYNALVWEDEREKPSFLEIVEASGQLPTESLADSLKTFILGSLDQYLDDIDPYTEMKIRQLQKGIEPVPADMQEARFAQAVRVEVDNFPVGENATLVQLKVEILNRIDQYLGSQ